VTPDERLTEVFDRGFRDGVETLSSVDRDLYRIQEFIIDYEMGGLSGYFYNRLPDLDEVRALIATMQEYRLSELAGLLTEAAALFDGYADPDPPTTWSKVLEHYDPTGRLNDLHRLIGNLDDYGLDGSTIG
jgi:hypothetical protein